MPPFCTLALCQVSLPALIGFLPRQPDYLECTPRVFFLLLTVSIAFGGHRMKTFSFLSRFSLSLSVSVLCFCITCQSQTARGLSFVAGVTRLFCRRRVAVGAVVWFGARLRGPPLKTSWSGAKWRSISYDSVAYAALFWVPRNSGRNTLHPHTRFTAHRSGHTFSVGGGFVQQYAINNK